MTSVLLEEEQSQVGWLPVTAFELLSGVAAGVEFAPRMADEDAPGDDDGGFGDDDEFEDEDDEFDDDDDDDEDDDDLDDDDDDY